MATTDELREAMRDYVTRANDNARVRTSLRSWSAVIHVFATDLDGAFTITVREGAFAGMHDGADGDADLIVRGGSEDLCDIFWGDANPVSNYMQGAITTQGRAEDVMRLDAMAMFVFLGQ